MHDDLDELNLLSLRERGIIKESGQLSFTANCIRVRELARRIIAKELEQRGPVPVGYVVVFPES